MVSVKQNGFIKDNFYYCQLNKFNTRNSEIFFFLSTNSITQKRLRNPEHHLPFCMKLYKTRSKKGTEITDRLVKRTATNQANTKM